MGLIEDDINQMAIQHLSEFKSRAYNQTMSLLKESGISVTGATGRRIKMEIEAQTNNVMASVQLEFPISAALTQSRRYYAKKASIDDLTQWVLDVGLHNFRFVPGYDKGQLPSQDRQARRIAWGIKNFKGANRKRGDIRQWLHKPFFQLWKAYREEVIQKYFNIITDRTSQIIQDALDA